MKDGTCQSAFGENVVERRKTEKDDAALKSLGLE